MTYEGCLEASSKRVVFHSNPLMFQRTSSQGARASSDRWRKLGSLSALLPEGNMTSPLRVQVSFSQQLPSLGSLLGSRTVMQTSL